MPRLTINGTSVEVGPGSTVLDAARKAGADVPKPIAKGPNVILMEYFGDEVRAAPILHGLRLEAREAREMFDRILWNIELFLSLDRIHADLSAYNILHWEGRAHYFAAAAEAMRRILIERARRKSRLKRGSGQVPLDIAEMDIAEALPDEKVLLVDEALERLKAEEPEKARIVVLKFFGGLTNEEVAEILGVNERTVRRQWEFAKAWLYDSISEQL